MAQAYISEVRIYSFGFAPKGWAQCNGQLMPISQNQALFSLLGTTYGGNGSTTFGLPNLQGSVTMHMGSGYVEGQRSGEINHTLVMGEMPSHTHTVIASGNAPNKNTPLNDYFASNTGFTPYGSPANEQMAPSACSNAGGSQPHNNMSPYLVLNYCICLQGIFPSRN